MYNYDYHKEQVMKFNALCGNTGSKEETPLYYKLTHEEMSEWITKGFLNKDLIEQVDAVADSFYTSMYLYELEKSLETEVMLSVVLHLYQQYSQYVNINRALEEVHRSNLSKFINVSGASEDRVSEIITYELSYITEKYKEKGIYNQDLDYELVQYKNEEYLVFKNQDGKVLKPSTFVTPDLSFIQRGE